MRINLKLIILPITIFSLTSLFSQNVNIDVNINIKHSVDGVSDFGRERHITVHSTPTEIDWDGEEDKLDYFVNDLDVYFGRDNGAATWKFQATEEDPNRDSHPDTTWMENFGSWLKGEYDKKLISHQYENKGAMIMGTNPHPLYPTYSWYPSGYTWTGWQPYSVETSTEWVVNYLETSFKKNFGESGEPLPKYWEVVNEIDMEFMTGKLLFTSYETVWEYHNLVREGLRDRLGEYAPKVGGMTWGQHDFTIGDGLGRITVDKAINDYGLNPDVVATDLEPYYKDAWFQWDILFQGFMDACPDMDFWSIHLYDWPQATSSTIRAGAVVEASLDMIEWYDNYKFGSPKELIVSEFGSVSGYLDGISMERRAWENLRPFNAMFLQFLERPSHITLTMPFAPVKAEWGDVYDANGNLTKRYPSTLMDKDANGDWQWTDFVLWYEQWSDVDGIRVETKSEDRDIQVDAYVDGNHLYLIMNSLQTDAVTLDLNIFGAGSNTVQSVQMKNLYLDESLGTHGEPVYDVRTFRTPPGSVILNGDATMILDYTFENPVSITDEVKEVKYMCDILEAGTTSIGGVKFRKDVNGRSDLTANINNVVVPTGSAEAVLRIGGRFWESGMVPGSITINGHELLSNPTYDAALAPDWKGENNPGRNYWFGVFEVDVPKEHLQESNTITCNVVQNATYTTVMLQVYDFSTAPKRSADGDNVPLTGISLPATLDLMQNTSESLQVAFTPDSATNKNITWVSGNPAVATVNEFGVVMAVASSGTSVITATSNDGGYTATTTVTAIPYTTTPVTGISIDEGSSLALEYYVTTPLHVTVEPENATEQNVVWGSADADIVTVDSVTGKVTGIAIGESTTITATLTDPNNGNAVHTASIDVSVGIVGEETIFVNALVDELTGNDTYTIDIPANIDGSRDITLDLMQGASVVGTGTASIDSIGRVIVPITLNLGAVPSIGSYYFRTTLSDGTTTICQDTAAVDILDIIHTDSIRILDWERRVQVGETLPVIAEVLPLNAYDLTVSWTSSDEGVATINPDGIVTGVTAGTSVITGTTNEGGLTAQVTITVQDGEVLEEPTSLIIAETVSVFPNENYTYELDFETEWTTEREVNWASSNPSIASVDENGVVTAGPIEGDVTITVTSESSTDVSAISNLSVSYAIIIEAEDFDLQGGPQADIGSSGNGINNVQTGDYVEYTVNIPKAGDYAASFFAGTEVADGVIELIIDSESKGSVAVPSGNWDTFEQVDLPGTFYLSTGEHTVRVLGAGTSQWQWNLEHFELRYQGTTDVEGVLMLSETLLIGVSQSRNLEATVYPESASNKNVSWSSDDETVATVDNGEVTGHSVGTANITVTTEEGSFEDVCVVTVQTDPVYILVESITIEPTEVNLKAGSTQQLSTTVLPENADDKTVSWESSDDDIATVSPTGIVTAHSNGTATITATANDDSGVSKEVVVNVVDIITIEAEDLTATGGTYADGNNNNMNVVAGIGVNYVNKGDWAEYDLDVPESGTYKMIYYISCPSPDGNITVYVNDIQESTDAIPDNGLTSNEWETYIPIEASSNATLMAGTHTLKIEASGSDWQWNLDKIELIKVGGITTVDVTGVSLSAVSDTLSIGETVNLTATVTPIDASNKNVSWGSDSESVAIVVDGIVTGVSAGNATITVTTQDGGFTAECSITVSPNNIAVTGISLNTGSETINTGESITLIQTIEPGNADNQNVTWNSSNEDIATVTAGVVTGVSAGEATITVTTVDGGHSVSATITVLNTVQGPLSITDPNEMSIELYPNPTSSLVMIDGLNEKSTIVIHDLNGKIYCWFDSNETTERIDVSNYPQGIYLVKVIAGEEEQRFRLIKN